MREVAVTEGNKVQAQIQFGWSVNGYGVGDLVEHVNNITDAEVNQLLDEYLETYEVAPEICEQSRLWASVREQARMELGIKSFLREGQFTAFTTTFEDLHGLQQLPGLAVQRLMAEGYGFGAEGDWKTAALVRIMKVMGSGLNGGTSFMEAYTYHFEPDNMKVMGAHMLEVCESIAAERPLMEIKPLSI